VKVKCLFILMTLWLFLPAAAHAQEQPDARWLRRSQESGHTPLRRTVYALLAKVKLLRDDDGRERGYYQMNDALLALARMGVDVLPVLAEALGDRTPTRAFHHDKQDRPTQPLLVNEAVARLIVQVAQHDFVIGEYPRKRLVRDVALFPELTPQFQKKIVAWWITNRDKTPVQRKIADLNDGWFRNRLDALEWLGRHKTVAGKNAVVRSINATLAREKPGTLTDNELAESALALGRIGDRSALPAVRRVRDRLLQYAEGPKNGSGYFLDYIAPSRLFLAYQGLALLGEKPRALRDLRQLYVRRAAAMRPSTRHDYERNLKAAALW